ncbi:MAG: FIST C-terminal domain-containing protein [Candidatus Omnitrophica bacterium]|jgi:hypothetical protein|nr:FIST C-terminal domain-containing protein [Candidatus Omnitrophota bacterium]
MSIKIGVGLSIEHEPVLAAKDALRRARNNLSSEKIDLAIVLSSVSLAYPIALKTISANLGDIPLIGCSGLAIICNQGIYKNGIIIMLLSFSKEAFFTTSCVKEIKNKGSLAAGEELGEKLLYGFQDVRRDLGIIFSAGPLEDSPGFILGLQERLGKSFPLIGGCASDNFAFKKTFIYFNREQLLDAVAAVILGGKLNFGIGTKHGWKPLGKPRQVTRAAANTVYEIDNKPAVNIYEEYFALDLSGLKKELKRISILYPIGIYLSGEEEYLLRNLVSVHDDGSLIFQDAIPKGAQIRLMIGTKDSCLLATRQALEEVQNGLFGRKANFALVFDSVSRYILLGRKAEQELKIAREMLGADTQIIGLYTFGEQAPLRAVNYQGMTRVHNQTISILGIST